MFVVIGGVDGCGKTSICKELQRRHLKRWVFSREPRSDLPVGGLLRKLIDAQDAASTPPRPELLSLFTAARHEHLAHLNSKGVDLARDVVVFDRYTESTAVYQQDSWPLGTILASFDGLPIPDLTIWLSTDTTTARERLRLRGEEAGTIEKVQVPSCERVALLHERYYSLFSPAPGLPPEERVGIPRQLRRAIGTRRERVMTHQGVEETADTVEKLILQAMPLSRGVRYFSFEEMLLTEGVASAFHAARTVLSQLTNC